MRRGLSRHNNRSAGGVTTAFTPLSLFADGSQGVWYDDSLTSSMYQESTGVTPAALESPVGLQLDLSQGLALGSELVTNGDGSSATGWNSYLGGTVTSNGSVLIITAAGGAYSGTSQNLTLVVGKSYELVAVVRSVSGSGLDIRVAFDGIAQTTTSTSFVTLRQIFTATSTARNLSIASTSSGGVVEVDNITIRSIATTPRFQATSANRPTLSARYNLLTKTEDFTNAVWSKYNAAATSTTAVNDPLGGATANKLVPSAGLSSGQVYNGTPVTVVSGVSYATVIYVKAAELGFAFVANDTRSSRTQAGVCVNLTTGEKTNAGADGTYTVTSVGNGWWQVLNYHYGNYHRGLH